VVNQQRGPAPRFSRANYTNVKEIPVGEEALAGTFFLNERPIIILFDFGAWHNFMSATVPRRLSLEDQVYDTPSVTVATTVFQQYLTM
jgi:hypothetical protein